MCLELLRSADLVSAVVVEGLVGLGPVGHRIAEVGDDPVVVVEVQGAGAGLVAVAVAEDEGLCHNSCLLFFNSGRASVLLRKLYDTACENSKTA